MKILVVGQGIAGTVLAWVLRRRGAAVQVADAGFPHQASGAAAGVINPVTGKRFVKTWRFDEFYAPARATYQAMQAELGCAVWFDQPILRLLAGPQELNDWAARLALPDYQPVLAERTDPGAWAFLLHAGFQIGEIKQAARVNFSALLPAFHRQLEAEGNLIAGEITADKAQQLAGEYDYIIFCEGYRGTANPFFPGLAWQLAKGEGCILRFDHPQAALLRDMVKRDLIVAPLGDGLFWTGATYNWTFSDDGHTDTAQQEITDRLRQILAAPFEVVRRFGAVRPTVKDRRPLIGKCPEYPRMVIFNGLGTKGALLAPFWASHLADHLLNAAPLDPEVAIQRFF